MKYLKELQEHIPYTVFAIVVGIVVLGILNFIAGNTAEYHELFHIFHPFHILFSSAATTSLFWKYEKKFIKALFIGTIGSVGICTLGDIIIPYIAMLLLKVDPHLHICFIEHPFQLLPFVIVGFMLGLMNSTTVYSHSSHVLFSSMASILYLISYGLIEWIDKSGIILIYMIFAVVIPCCCSDIIFPLFFCKKIKNMSK